VVAGQRLHERLYLNRLPLEEAVGAAVRGVEKAGNIAGHRGFEAIFMGSSEVR
jgi:hypothetical protein